jgi:hypothetical protein
LNQFRQWQFRWENRYTASFTVKEKWNLCEAFTESDLAAQRENHSQ